MKENFRFPQGCKLEQQNNRLYFPKIGWIRYRNSRDVVGEIKNVTVSQKCGRFFRYYVAVAQRPKFKQNPNTCLLESIYSLDEKNDEITDTKTKVVSPLLSLS
ncbi:MULTISPECIES: hypothetical protein [Neisseria]|uniref:hypothetical protein n=1 Tax=Neisseria TaxID=482 RepID=UPI002658D5E0|nr:MULTISPECIES: hypothetical protein [Neisseria]